jgi:regulator of protease activity HflC (stomatin/prohibitin superfamily)
VDEHVVPAVVADDEAESLLGIEELHDALPFADDLGRHASTAAEATASAAAIAAAAESTAIAIASASATEAAAILESAAVTVTVFSEEPVALVPSATATVAPTPSIETHTG